MKIEDDFTKRYISTMAHIGEILKTNTENQKDFQDTVQALIKELSEAVDRFSKNIENVGKGQFIWGIAAFATATLAILEKQELTPSEMLERTLFVASGLYLGATQDLSDVLSITE